MCEIFFHYIATTLSGCTVALFAYWLHKKTTETKIGDCSHTIKTPSLVQSEGVWCSTCVKSYDTIIASL
ncbi:type I toxin-antitoxin system Fst family toxin [Staphylococcus pseudintermedius]